MIDEKDEFEEEFKDIPKYIYMILDLFIHLCFDFEFRLLTDSCRYFYIRQLSGKPIPFINNVIHLFKGYFCPENGQLKEMLVRYNLVIAYCIKKVNNNNVWIQVTK